MNKRGLFAVVVAWAMIALACGSTKYPVCGDVLVGVMAVMLLAPLSYMVYDLGSSHAKH